MAALIDAGTQFIDETTGVVINNGYVYIGDDTLDPEANPQTIYSDRDLTVTITNPQRTGTDGRTVNKIWIANRFSIKVEDENNVQRYQELTNGETDQTGASSLSNVSGTNTITADGTPTITALLDTQIFSFIAAGTITGAVTLQIDATSALAVLKYHDQPLIAGDIEANQAVTVIYNDTDTVFELISSTLNPQIQSITATVASSALTLGLNPTSQYFRRTPLTDGLPNIRSNAALSLVVPSGATLGTTNAVESRITLIAIDNAGTVELACINAISTVIDETGLITTLAIGTGSDSEDVFYSTSARTSVPYRVVGFEDSTQSTAGTWDTSPALIQGAGGEAFLPERRPQPQTVITTTSGTTHDFTIPSFVNEFTVMLDVVSTDGTSDYLIRLGTGGTPETTGYSGGFAELLSSSVVTIFNAVGIIIGNPAGTGDTLDAKITFTRMTGNTWSSDGSCELNAGTDSLGMITGNKTLAGALDIVRLTTVSADTFDAGTFNISY